MAEIPSFRSSINGFHRGDVIEFIKKILDENALLTEELSREKEEKSELQAEIENYRNQIEGFHTDRQNEQVLGRAMYDARRFSDELVREAVDQANGPVAAQICAHLHGAAEIICARARLYQFIHHTCTCLVVPIITVSGPKVHLFCKKAAVRRPAAPDYKKYYIFLKKLLTKPKECDTLYPTSKGAYFFAPFF